MQTYIYKLSPLNPQLHISPTEMEISNLSKHFAYLQKHTKSGKVLLAGRTEDAEYGIVIFKAENLDKANEFSENDPAVLSKMMTASVKPFSIALTGLEME